jgi:hypothetical protein
MACWQTFCLRQHVKGSFTTLSRENPLFGANMVNRTAITPNQLRAARGWLGWSRGKLCLKSGVSERAIAQYELGRSVPHDETLSRLRSTFEVEGIRFQFVGSVATGIGIEVEEDRMALTGIPSR